MSIFFQFCLHATHHMDEGILYVCLSGVAIVQGDLIIALCVCVCVCWRVNSNIWSHKGRPASVIILLTWIMEVNMMEVMAGSRSTHRDTHQDTLNMTTTEPRDALVEDYADAPRLLVPRRVTTPREMRDLIWETGGGSLWSKKGGLDHIWTKFNHWGNHDKRGLDNGKIRVFSATAAFFWHRFHFASWFLRK